MKTTSQFRGEADSGVRHLGLGAACPSDPATAMQQALTACPFNQIPVLEYVTLTIPLPVTDTAITSTFGDTINVLNVGQTAPPGVASVDSSFGINGLLQTNMLACGLGVHAFGEPISFTQIGNGVLSSLTTYPVSPDVFSQDHDLPNGALGPTATGSVIPAQLEWGFAAWMALWHMMNGYQFQWIVCQRYQILNELGADVAYYGPYAEGEGMGDSDVSVQQFAKQVNAQYRGINAGNLFLPVSHRRYGSVNGGGTGATIAANTGVFHPTRDFDLAPVTFGGLRNQGGAGCCQPFRKFAKPIYLQTGIPIIMKLVAQDQYHQTQMQRFMSVSEGAGTNATALVQVDSTLNGSATQSGATPNAGLEITLDQGGNQFAAQSANPDRLLFKGGVMKLAMMIKGFEVCGMWNNCFTNQATAGALSGSVYIPTMQGTSGVPGLVPTR
jgi:hypothetical protein